VTAERWRYIDSGPCRGAENMAVDEALLESHAGGECPPTLRVYTWRPPAVSLGHFQRADSSVDLEASQRLGLDVVRRPTGGRAIFHTQDEVTFSFVVSAERLGTRGVMESYRRIADGILAGLRSLGLDARLVERSSHTRAAGQDPACFAVKARCDLVVGSAKLVGSAQVQRHGFLLQQNSLPLTLRLSDWAQVFRRKTTAPAAAGLWEAAGRQVPYDEVAAALRQGFEGAFGVVLEESELTCSELARSAELAPRVLAGASPQAQ